MKNSLKSLVLGASLAFGFASSALGDSPATKQWVLATAKATGRGGENFISSLRIVNPGLVEANVTLVYLAQTQIGGDFAATPDNNAPPTSSFKVAAGQMVPIEDVIGTLFGLVGAGGIKVVSDQPVSVLSRTYASNAVSATGKPGTFGFSIPAQVDDQAIAVGDVGYIPYIAASPDSSTGFRCNFIMLNTVAATSVVHVALKKADGTVKGERDYTLGKLSAAQQGDIAASFSYAGPDEDLFVVVTVKSGGPVVVGTSIVDNAISSLNYAPPTKVLANLPVVDGDYGIMFHGDPFFTSGRIDVASGAPFYMFAVLATDSCGYYLVLQALSSRDTSNPNTTFTKNADGSYSFTGGSTTSLTSASWTGTITFTSDGGLTGTLTYTRGPTDSTCPNTTITTQFLGHYSAPLSY